MVHVHIKLKHMLQYSVSCAYFWRKFLLVLRSEVRFNYILSMHSTINDSIIDLGCVHFNM